MIAPNMILDRNKALAILKMTEEELKKISLEELQKKYQKELAELNNALQVSPGNAKKIADEIKQLNSAFDLLKQEKTPPRMLLQIDSGDKQTETYSLIGSDPTKLIDEYNKFVGEKYEDFPPEKLKEFKPQVFNNLEDYQKSDSYKNDTPEKQEKMKEILSQGNVSVIRLKFNSPEDANEFINNMLGKGIISRIAPKVEQNVIAKSNDDEYSGPSPFSTSLSRV